MIKRVVILTILVVVLGLAAFVWWSNGISPVNFRDTSNKIFVIEKGAAIREIGNKLKREGLIRDPVVFFLYLKFENTDKAIQAGDYKLSASMGLPAIIQNLKHGTLDYWVTFPEGMRTEEYATILKDKITTYNESWSDALSQNQGYLFPDTYLIPRDATIDVIVTLMKNNFYKKIESIGLTRTSSSLSRVVIIASLIEREAKTDAEKSQIAGVITNRLNEGVALQIDATVQYAKGYDPIHKSWWRPVTLDEYKSVRSLYNTYIYPGLPPGPISNPGLEALKSAVHPADTPYFYYLHDSKGQIHYAKTVQEHNANIQKYLE